MSGCEDVFLICRCRSNTLSLLTYVRLVKKNPVFCHMFKWVWQQRPCQVNNYSVPDQRLQQASCWDCQGKADVPQSSWTSSEEFLYTSTEQADFYRQCHMITLIRSASTLSLCTLLTQGRVKALHTWTPELLQTLPIWKWTKINNKMHVKSRKDAATANHPQSEGLIKSVSEGWVRGSGW